MNVEEWKPVEDFPRFEVSNLGHMRTTVKFSKIGSRVKLLKLRPNLNGYCMVALYRRNEDGSYFTVSRPVHALVAKSFVPGHAEGLHVHHIDENKINNRADNLKWVTPSENQSLNTKRTREGGRAAWTFKQVEDMRKMVADGKPYSAVCAEFPGMKPFYLSRIVSMKIRKKNRVSSGVPDQVRIDRDLVPLIQLNALIYGRTFAAEVNFRLRQTFGMRVNVPDSLKEFMWSIPGEHSFLVSKP